MCMCVTVVGQTEQTNRPDPPDRKKEELMGGSQEDRLAYRLQGREGWQE